MSVYKEARYCVDEIEKQSRQLFIDAADYGVPVYSFNDKIITMTKGIMIDYYQSKVSNDEYGQTLSFDGGKGAQMEAGFAKCSIRYTKMNPSLTNHPSLIVDKGIIGYLQVKNKSYETI